MLIATVLSLWPGLIYIAAAVVLGIAFWRRTHRLALSSLVASAIIITLCILIRTELPWGFRFYVQDLMYEPLVRDWLRHPGESIASTIAHFGLPYAILAVIHWVDRTRGRKTSSHPLERTRGFES